ncbi:MAG: hypothetical protein K8H86_12435 [Ignavibacteriaceae bacterium]|nr:hypothetical protein [Ignavibacteriaceae bacterium]
MKQLIFTLFLAGVFFAGCSDFNNTTIPANSQSTVQKIKMPAPKNLSVETTFTVSERIAGNFGGELLLDGFYPSTTGDVMIEAELIVPSGAYSGEKVLSISNEGQFVEVSLDPSMQFDAPVLLSVRMDGLDLSDVNPETIQFLYFADDGSTESVTYDELIVDVENGILGVRNAQLTHFSRYGFAK